MTKEELISAFDDPGRIAAFDTDVLADLVEENPCSGMLRMVYVKSLKLEDDIRFEHEMRGAAAHLPVRAKLYEWLKRAPEYVKENSPTSTSIAKPEEEKETVAPKDEASIELVVKSEEDPVAPINDPIHELERQYLTEAVSVSIGMEVEAEIDHIDVSRNEEPTNAMTLSTEVDPAEVRSMEEEGIEERGVDSFLDFISGGGIQEAPSPEDAQNPSHRIREEKHRNDELIEHFIRNEKREKVEFFDPVRMAKASLVDNEELVTETLARVYQHQGNLQKALRAYETLQLKYPEKRLYFAGRIERVKELIKKRKQS